MDIIKQILFERTFLLCLVLGTVQLILIGVWSRWRSARAFRVMAAGFGAIPLLLITQWAVVTDREELIRQCEHMGDAVEAADQAAFVALLHADFKTDRYDRDSIGRALGRTLRLYKVEEASLRAFDVELSGNAATVRFGSRCRLVTPEHIFPMLTSRWEIRFLREADQWLGTRIDCLQFGGQTGISVQELLR